MGELLSKEMIGDLIINIINILVLFFVTRALLYRPVKKFLEARREKAAATLNEAEKAKQEAELSKQKYDALMAEAETAKENAVSEAVSEARESAGQIVADARQQADTIVKDARDEAKRTQERAVRETQGVIADIALEISSKIIRRSVNDEDNRRIIESFFSEQAAE